MGDLGVTGTRNRSLDAVKFVAAVAVVAIHVFPAPATLRWVRVIVDNAARFALPFFFATSGYLFVQGIESGREPREQLGRSLRRLLFLYVVWSAIYFVDVPFGSWLHSGVGEIYAKKLHTLASSLEKLLFVGPTIHLWFLVSLAMALLFLYLCRGFRRPALAIVLSIPIYGIGVWAGTHSEAPWGLRLPMHTRYGLFFSALCVSLGAAARTARLTPRPGAALTVLGTGVLLHFGEVAWLHARYGLESIGRDYVFGTVLMGWGALLLALSRPRWLETSPLAHYGRLSEGVYLIHPIVAMHAAAIRPLVSPAVWMIVAPVLAATGAMAATKLLERFSWGRPLVH